MFFLLSSISKRFLSSLKTAHCSTEVLYRKHFGCMRFGVTEICVRIGRGVKADPVDSTDISAAIRRSLACCVCRSCTFPRVTADPPGRSRPSFSLYSRHTRWSYLPAVVFFFFKWQWIEGINLFKSIACLRSIVVTVEKVLHATQALRCIMKSYQVHPTERSASLRASRDLAPLHLANPCVTDRVYLASADSTMWALWLGKHKRRTCSCDPTHLPETTSSIWAFYPWRDRASAETKETLCCFCFFCVCF